MRSNEQKVNKSEEKPLKFIRLASHRTSSFKNQWCSQLNWFILEKIDELVINEMEKLLLIQLFFLKTLREATVKNVPIALWLTTSTKQKKLSLWSGFSLKSFHLIEIKNKERKTWVSSTFNDFSSRGKASAFQCNDGSIPRKNNFILQKHDPKSDNKKVFIRCLWWM